MNKTTVAVIFGLLLLFAARLISIGGFELSPDEAYYSMWSERLDWAYYSKGPGVALVIRAGTALFGMNEFGIRFFSPVLSLLTGFVVFAFTRKLYGEGAAVLAVCLLNCIPIFNVGSLVMTIDPLSIFFWICAVAAFWFALEKPGMTGWWAATGLLIGLGFLCKYTNALLLASVALVLVVFSRHRRRFREMGPYILLASAAVCAIPPVIWNINNDWVTAVHIRDRAGMNNEAWKPTEILEFVGAHAGVYSPLIFGALVWVFIQGIRDWGVHNRARYVMCFAAPIIVLYFGLSVIEAGEANWTAPGFATLAIYAAHVLHQRMAGSAGLRRFTHAALAVGILMSFLVTNTDLVRIIASQTGFKFEWSYTRDPSTRLRGWETSAEAIAAMRIAQSEESGRPLFLIANKYGTAAAIGFYLPEKTFEGPRHPAVYAPETQAIQNQFAFWPRYDGFEIDEETNGATDSSFTEQRGVNHFMGRDALYFTDDVKPDLKAPKGAGVRDGFETCRWLADLIVNRRGQRLRVLRVFLCEGYKSSDL